MAVFLNCWLAGLPTAWGQLVEEEEIESATTSSGKNKPEGNARLLPEVAASIISKTNQFREEQSLKPVEANSELMLTAQYFASYMARTNRYGHAADGQRPADRAKQHDYAYCIVSENIAYQYSPLKLSHEELSQRFTVGWKESPGHRKNMLDPDVTETGVAVAQSEETGYHYAVQMFGRPKSASIHFEVENRAGVEVEYQIGERTFTLPTRYTRTHQRCRPKDLVFRWPKDAEQEKRTVRPSDGDSFVIVHDSGKYQVRQAN